MIEVFLHRNDREVAYVSCEDAETALFAAQTLWDDECRASMTQGTDRAMRVSFYVDGALTGISNGVRPS